MNLDLGYSVLITDDDEGCRKSLQSILEPIGYQTYLASDGFEALEIIKNEIIDLAILDFNLPGMTGVETWERIKKEEKLELPCVFITGDSKHALELDEMVSPTITVLHKPLTKEGVMGAMEFLMK